MFIISAFRLQLTFILLQGTSSQFCLRLNAIICESSPSSPSSILPQLPRSVNRRTRFSDRKLSVLNPRLPHALLGSLDGEVLTFPLSGWLTIARSILLRDTLKTYPATFTTRPRSTETSTTLHSSTLRYPSQLSYLFTITPSPVSQGPNSLTRTAGPLYSPHIPVPRSV